MLNRKETLESIIARLRATIRKKNLKNSKQREEVLNTLYKNNNHLTPEEITQILKNKNKNASISSIYRILSFLEKEKFITVLESDKNGKRYEIAAKGHHDHLICLECGDIKEFVDTGMEKTKRAIAELNDSMLISHDVRLFVLCQRCQNLTSKND